MVSRLESAVENAAARVGGGSSGSDPGNPDPPRSGEDPIPTAVATNLGATIALNAQQFNRIDRYLARIADAVAGTEKVVKGSNTGSFIPGVGTADASTAVAAASLASLSGGRSTITVNNTLNMEVSPERAVRVERNFAIFDAKSRRRGV